MSSNDPRAEHPPAGVQDSPDRDGAAHSGAAVDNGGPAPDRDPVQGRGPGVDRAPAQDRAPVPDRAPDVDASGRAANGAGPTVPRGAPAKRPPRQGGRRRGGALGFLGEWVAIVAIAALAAIGIKTWVVQAFYIPSASMEPTLGIGNRILVDKLSYDLHSIHRGDIVVFARPANDGGDPTIKDLVKRVVGLPGETISSANGHVVINGRPLAEPYLPTGTQTSGVPTQTVPSGHYFVMGDNRTDSADSRVFGPIPASLVVGHTIVRIWPPSRLHIF